MVKKYNKIEDYFIDKEQLKKYKDLHYLNSNEFDTIKFTNKNHCCEFNSNLYNINNMTVEFVNSSFSNFALTEYNNNNKLIFKNCTFKNVYIDLTNKSSVEFENCSVEKLVIKNAENIKLDNITDIYYDIILGNENTKNINIYNFKFETPGGINIEATGENINIARSNIILKYSDTDNLIVEYSNLNIKNINVNNYINVFDSSIDGKNNNKELKTKKIKVDYDSRFSNCVIQTDVMNISNYSSLELDNSILDVSETLILKEDSCIFDDWNKSFLIVPDVFLQKDTEIDLGQLYYKNTTEYWEELKLNDLYNEREKLVKTLKLVENKYNKPIKELR